MRLTLRSFFAPVLFAAALAFSFVATVDAQSKHPRSINAREHRQQQRILQGERSGELTRREAERLAAEQAKIRVDEAYARHSGGRLTRAERARLERELNRSSKDIYRQKHDRQDRN